MNDRIDCCFPKWCRIQIFAASNNQCKYRQCNCFKFDGEVLYQYAQTQNINELAAELGIEAGDIQKAAADGLDVEILQGNFEVTAGKRHDFYEAVRDTVCL